MNEQDLNNDLVIKGITTYFAPAERASKSLVDQYSQFVSQHPLFQAILESVDGYLMILNPQRQVLAVNQQLFKALKIDDIKCLLGDRPGEILGCIHASEGPSGCGTSHACASCGAVISIWDSQKTGQPQNNECLATVKHGTYTECHEFKVRSTPVKVGDNEFTVLIFNDISGEKRRDALERTFFHDIMNTLGGLMGWSYILSNVDNSDPKQAAVHIMSLSLRLQKEIEDQRRLVDAENGILEINQEPLVVHDILENLRQVFSAHPVTDDKYLQIEEFHGDLTIQTDLDLLGRVLVNMVKNAMEAINPGETVRVFPEKKDNQILFNVHNPGMIPPEVSVRIFQRSFSTKAEKGRGIGTYSMKLFGEQYLGGKVGFNTSEQDGTTFYIALPFKDNEQ